MMQQRRKRWLAALAAGLMLAGTALVPAKTGEAETARERPAVSVSASKASKPASAPVSWSDLQRRYRGVFVLRASASGGRRVALTFDDVPDPRYTPLVLNVLKRKRVRATFFVVGSRASKHPGLVRRIVNEGHAVGNHTYSHPELPKLSLGQVKREIERTGAEIRETAGFEPAMIRPPYGDIRPAQLEWARSRGYTVVNWDVDSQDWRQIPSGVVLRNALKGLRPGSIVLMHAGGGSGQNLFGTVNALPHLIDQLRAKGYELVTVPELLHIPERRPNRA
ncbi:polysaccharide deacetylase family protein [Cohnella rhizosphaerae]|uniref:Polysaccharide deacetylase family protein n=1 Tax=Cohnella rhizosphaerae TaxID=1457232 RepID=A0A9X4L096_9BACL|nr:polysaccharide deacetylase family protein [Cohnella rhizosphaerae]MDG0814626.1 polysaccharide deacetylase family protein [Cohnella rhizosphaerae]